MQVPALAQKNGIIFPVSITSFQPQTWLKQDKII